MTQDNSGDTAYVIVLDGINAVCVRTIMESILFQINKTVKHLYFIVSTNGGSVPHGIALYNVLRTLPFDITMHNISNVDSIGNVVFLAADKRYATPNATFMIHPVQSTFQNKNGDINVLKEKISAVEADEKRIKEIFLKRTSIPSTELKKYFHTGAVQTASHALKSGLIHEIRDIFIDPDAQIILVGTNEE